jgi:SEC-C motif-containing protein
MRSRYAAFVLGDSAYLRYSWAPDRCPEELRIDPRRTWTGLRIHATSGGAAFETSGTVHFTAFYKGGEYSEHSLFRRHEGRWVYEGPSV